jgi:hypothetical protein
MTAALGLLVGCQSVVGDYDTDLDSASEPVDSAPLCDVEREQFTFEIDLESTDQLADLTDYYAAANPDLIAHLDGVSQEYQAGQPHGRVTYIQGAAGVGKSFITRHVTDLFLDTEQCDVGLGDLFGEESNLLTFPITQRADLATLDSEIVFNELPSAEDVVSFDLISLLDAAGCLVDGTLVSMVVIDDLDEVHAETSAAILEAVDQLILDNAPEVGPFLHVLIAGRPEGFWDWLTDTERNEDNSAIVDRFVLNAPVFQTAGDLDFRLRGFYDFTGGLEALDAAGETDAYVESFTTAVATHPFLTYSVGNLAVGSFVIEQTVPGLDQSEQALKEGVFDAIIGRDSDSHGRPGDGSQHDAAYDRVLEDIAVRYAEVDKLGEFAVRSQDTVEVVDHDGNVLGEVNVRNVLNRSGVAFLTSATSTATRYRFEPIWLHTHLIERYNQRTDPDYTYRTCE